MKTKTFKLALIFCIMHFTPLLFLGEGMGVRCFAQPTWVTSGAAIGNVSTYTYPASWASTTLTLINPSSQDELKVSDVTGSPSGVHIYGVNAAPSITTGITGLGSNDRYFGVFVANGTTPSYTVTYNYTGNPYVGANENNLLLFKRNNNASTPWADASATLDVSANTLTKTSESSRGEYILGLSSGVLPVELLYFDAVVENNSLVRCKWSTATEINNDYFAVERSQDGNNFSQIGTVKVAGNSNTTLYYEFDDQLPYIGLSYYRLKQTDYDGKYSYSQIEVINVTSMNIKNINIINIFPNPAIDNFEYKIGSTEKMPLQVKVVDMLGQIVINKTENIEKGTSSKSMNISRLSSGTYILQLITETQEVIGKQFQIK